MHAQLSSRLGAQHDDGASAVEYSLIVFAIAAVIVAVVFTLGRTTQSAYQGACDAWDTAAATTDC